MFLTKSFHEIFTLSKSVFIFKSKASPEKRKTVLTSNYTLTYQKQRRIFAEKDMCVSHKTFHEIHTHSFFSNPTRNPKPNPNLKPNSNTNPKPYLTLTLTLEIHTLSKKGDYLSK